MFTKSSLSNEASRYKYRFIGDFRGEVNTIDIVFTLVVECSDCSSRCGQVLDRGRASRYTNLSYD